MGFQQRPNSGALFPNDRKENDRHPDYKGDFNIDGVNYWIKGWIKQSQRGEFISISVEKKQAPDVNAMADKHEAQNNFQKPDNSHRRAEQAPPDHGFDDGIPF